MSGVCPVPSVKSTTDFTTTGTYEIAPPTARFNECSPSTNTNINNPSTPVTTTVCCPTPGVPGPTGPTGIDGTDAICARGYLYKEDWADATEYFAYDPDWDVCNDDVVLATDGKLYLCILEHISSPDTEPGVGVDWTAYWVLFLQGAVGGSSVVYDLTDGECYEAGNLVNHEGCIYSADEDICVDFADPDTVPDKYLDGGFYWTLVSCPETGSWFDDLFGGSGSWLEDIANWGLNQLLSDVATYYLTEWLLGGDDLDDAMNFDGGIVDANYKGPQTCISPVSAPTLQQVVSSICDLRGLSGSQYDVSALPTTDEINMTVGQMTTGKNLLELLALTYQFGMIDVGGVLKFIPHNPASSVKTLTTYEDLGYVSGGKLSTVPYTVKRMQSNDLPKEVNLTYKSAANIHEPFVQTATLETMTEGNVVNLEVPMTLTEQEAYEIAERILVNSHIGSTTYSFTTSYRNIELEPEDIITVENLGDLRILRIEEDQQGGLLNIVAVNAANNDYTYTASSITPAAPPTYSEVPKVVSASSGLIFESHPFDPIPDNTLRMRIAPHGYGVSGWAGCDVYYSTDNVTYIGAGSVTNEATWGAVATAISGNATYYEKDTTTSINVQLKTGILSSASELDVLNGTNNALIGEEIIGFETVVDNGGGSYTLSNLRRGLKGTEVHIGTHQNKEAFILIDSNVIKFDVSSSMMGKSYYFKFVTKGSSLADATPVQYVPNGKSRRPWAVANFNAEQVGYVWNISWLARNQFDPELQDYKATPYPSMCGGFAMNILNPVNDEIVRSITQQTPSFTYTEAMQIEDFGVAQTSIKLQVAQIDRVVGLGYRLEETF